MKRIKEVLIITGIVFAIYAISHLPEGIDSALAAGSGMALWFAGIALFVLLLRALYLPVQFLRHRAALDQVECREQQLIERVAAGNAVARISLSMRSLRDPRDVPWWRW